MSVQEHLEQNLNNFFVASKEKAAEAKATRRCVAKPIGCGAPVHAKDFRDDLSRREYNISGLCQKCQDEVFGFGDSEGGV